THGLQGVLVCHFPADVLHVVIAVGMQGEAMMIFIHLQEERAVIIAPVVLQTENVRRKLLPGLDVTDSYTQIAKLSDAYHTSLLLLLEICIRVHPRASFMLHFPVGLSVGL